MWREGEKIAWDKEIVLLTLWWCEGSVPILHHWRGSERGREKGEEIVSVRESESGTEKGSKWEIKGEEREERQNGWVGTTYTREIRLNSNILKKTRRKYLKCSTKVLLKWNEARENEHKKITKKCTYRILTVSNCTQPVKIKKSASLTQFQFLFSQLF